MLEPLERRLLLAARAITGTPPQHVPGVSGAIALNLLQENDALTTAPPTNLRVNDAVNPVGTGSAVYFGWFGNDPDINEIQTKYQILVASTQANLDSNIGDKWNSGEVVSRLQNHVEYGGSALAADTLYFWKVRTWDKDGTPSNYSASSKFVVGPTSTTDWSGAKWIKRNTTVTDDYTYYRKTTALPDKTVAYATAYISAVHRYTLYLNGNLVGEGQAYHYAQYQYYNGFDITNLVQANGNNTFAVFTHWFGGGQGRPASARGLIMKAVIHYTDGTSTVIGTDGTWKHSQATSWIVASPNPVHQNSGEGVGFQERIDARNLTPDWYAQAFDDSAWTAPTEIGVAGTSPFINALAPDLTRIVENEIAPISVTYLGSGKYVVDLGKVYAGVPKVTFSGGTSGTLVTMLGGFGLTGAGVIDETRHQSTQLKYFTILNGGTYVYEPAEYFGFRYFQIDNSPMPVTTSNFKFVVRHSEMSSTNSSFTSPDTTLNGVWDFMKYSLFVGAQEEFVDTPTREKGGFLGDAAIQSTAAMPVTGERLLTNRVIREYLQSMDQHWSSVANQGRMNAVYPNNDGARDIPDYTQAYLPWVWDYYMQTGDKKFLIDQFAKFKQIGQYVNNHTNVTTGLITQLTGGSGAYQYGIVDWPSPMRYGYDMTAAARTVVNCWAYADYDTIAKIADEIGNTVDRDLYRQRAEDLKAAINSQLINTDGVYIDGLSAAGVQSAHVSQHANMFPLALNIVPAANFTAVTNKVKELQMSVGMVTVMQLVKALGEADEGEQLIELYTNETWDGWARSLARGATVTWEDWNADSNGNSESHPWGAAGLYGYVNYVLGVTPTKAQFESVRIKPLYFGDSLLSAEGTLPTDRGAIAVDWERSGGTFSMVVTTPDNVTADVYVPLGPAGLTGGITIDGLAASGVVEGEYFKISGVGSGTHQIVYHANPYVVGNTFAWQTFPQRLEFRFDRDVGASITADDLVLCKVMPGPDELIEGIVAAWDPTRFKATFSWPAQPNSGALANGFYKATILKDGVLDDGGRTMGADYEYEFSFINGDSNHDGYVDARDLYSMSQTWLQSSGFNYSAGDFNYDGFVDQIDLTILSQNWQTTLSSLLVPAPSLPVVSTEPVATATEPAPPPPGERAPHRSRPAARTAMLHEAAVPIGPPPPRRPLKNPPATAVHLINLDSGAHAHGKVSGMPEIRPSARNGTPARDSVWERTTPYR